MADKRISELTALTGANSADDDLLVIVDSSASETKSITLGELEKALGERDFSFADDDKLVFGDGDDLQIYHDGSNSYISDQGTGNLKILANSFVLKDSTDTNNMMVGLQGDATKLFYNGSEKLATTNTGIDVTGTVTAAGSDFVGIQYERSGTNSPAFRLSNATTGSLTQIEGNNSGNMIFKNGAGSLSESMRIDSLGNLGLGVTPEAWRSGERVLQIGENSSIHSYSSLTTNLASNQYIDSGNTARYIQSSGFVGYTQRPDLVEHQWYIAPSGTADAAITKTQAMTLDSDGNLGIGDTSPSSIVDITKDSTTTWTSTITGSPGYAPRAHELAIKNTTDDLTNSYAAIFFQAGETSSGSQINSARIAAIRTAAFDTDIAFSTRSTSFSNNMVEHVRINSAGSVIIGDQSNAVKRTNAGSDYGGAAAPQLTAKANAGTYGQVVILNGNGSGSNSPNLSFGHKNSSGNYTYGGTITLQAVDTTAGSEDYDLTFSTQSGGGSATEAARFTSSGNLKFPNGHGIDFSASAGSGASSSILDDYEEGTWTPTYGGSTTNPTITYDSRTAGTYVKVGKLVTLSFAIVTDALSGGSGNVQLGGFPFTNQSTTGEPEYGGITIGWTGNFGGDHPCSGILLPGLDYANLTYRTSANGGTSYLNVAGDLGSGANANLIYGTIVYFTA